VVVEAYLTVEYSTVCHQIVYRRHCFRQEKPWRKEPGTAKGPQHSQDLLAQRQQLIVAALPNFQSSAGRPVLMMTPATSQQGPVFQDEFPSAPHDLLVATFVLATRNSKANPDAIGLKYCRHRFSTKISTLTSLVVFSMVLGPRMGSP
jgi:hypothetical protein